MFSVKTIILRDDVYISFKHQENDEAGGDAANGDVWAQQHTKTTSVLMSI